MHQNKPDTYMLGFLGSMSITASISFGHQFLIPGLFAPDIRGKTKNQLLDTLSTTWSSQLSC